MVKNVPQVTYAVGSSCNTPLKQAIMLLTAIVETVYEPNLSIIIAIKLITVYISCRPTRFFVEMGHEIFRTIISPLR